MRPSCRLFGYRYGPGKIAVSTRIRLAQEAHRLEVLPAAMDIGNPLAGLAAIVEVEHRSDRIDPQSVDVVAIEPEQRIRFEEVGNFAPAEIVDKRVPILVQPQPRILILIQCCSVEASQTVRIAGKMCRNPIDQHAYAVLMAAINETHKGLWRTETGRRGKQADGLISPRARKGMLTNRQELNVRKAEIANIRNELTGEAVVV